MISGDFVPVKQFHCVSGRRQGSRGQGRRENESAYLALGREAGLQDASTRELTIADMTRSAERTP